MDCLERFYVGLNFPRKFLRNVSTFSYILFVKRILSFFSIETDLIKPHVRGIRDDMKEILMLPDATSAIKEGANKRRIKSRIKPGRIFFPSNRTLLYGATPSNVILFVNPKGGHG